MAILNDLYYKQKQNHATSFPYVNEQELGDTYEQPIKTPSSSLISDNIPVSTTSEENKEVAKLSIEPEVKYPNKPQSLSDDDYEHLLKFNTPEQISKYYEPFNPSNGENYLQRIFESSISKPSAPDKKRISNARTMGVLGDSIQLLGEMFVASKGAHISKRDPKSSALTRIMDRQDKDRNIYLDQLVRYENGLYSARMRDFLKALDDYNNGRRGIQSVLATKQALDERARQADEIMRLKREQEERRQQEYQQDYELKKQGQENTRIYQSQRLTNDAERDKVLNAKDKAYIERGGRSSTPKSVPLYFKDGTNIDIPENIWKANYPALVDILIEEGVKLPMTWLASMPSASQVEYFIKQNKDNLPDSAKRWLSEISRQNPAEYESYVEDEEEYNTGGLY